MKAQTYACAAALVALAWGVGVKSGPGLAAQTPWGRQSEAIELTSGEALSDAPLGEYPGGLSLRTYLRTEHDRRLRVRHLDAALAVVDQRDLIPPPGYEALDWVTVDGGREIIAVLVKASEYRSHPGDVGIHLAGYAVATGAQTFLCPGPAHVKWSGTRLSVSSTVDPSGRHVAVALLFVDDLHRLASHASTSLALLTLDGDGRLASRLVEQGLRGVPTGETPMSLSVDARGTAVLAIAARDTIHLLRSARATATVVHQRAYLPHGYRVQTLGWTQESGTDTRAVLLGISTAERPWRHEVSSFAIRFGEDDAPFAEIGSYDVSGLWPKQWRQLSTEHVEVAAPAAVAGWGVAIAMQRKRTREKGHPKQSYRRRETIFGDVLVAVIGIDGQVRRAETIQRNLAVPANSPALSSSALRLVPAMGAFAVMYTTSAEHHFQPRSPLAKSSAPNLTIYQTYSASGVPVKARIVHDDGEEYAGLPHSISDADRLGHAFLTVEKTGDGSQQKTRVRVTLTTR